MVYPSISPLERILPKTMRALSEVIHDIAPRFGWSGDALGMLEANPEIAVAIAAGEIWSTTSMAKWIYKKGKSFVTPNKKRKKGAPSIAPRSQLPAQPKGDMPFGNKRSREWNDITRRVRQRPTVMKRYNGITGHYRKSKRRKRVQDPRGVVNVYDDHDEVTADNALWMYSQDHGSQDRMIKIGVQAIVKAALATIFIHPTNPAFLITTGSPENELQIRFRRTRGLDPIYEDTTEQTTVNGQTFQAVCDALFTLVKTEALQGFYPYSFRFEGGDRGNEYRSLGDSIITLTASAVTRVQNTTLDDSMGTATSNRINSNPVKGKIYKTKGFVPYIRPSIVHNNAGLVGFHESPATGMNQAVIPSDDSFMNHPPTGTTLFRHCTGSRLVKMQAGSIMPIRSSFRTRMTVLNYFKKCVHANVHQIADQPNMFGSCTVLALEQTMRSAASEAVRVGINRELTMKAYVRLKTKVPTIHSYTSTGVLV
jgi:hypothetical protein